MRRAERRPLVVRVSRRLTAWSLPPEDRGLVQELDEVYRLPTQQVVLARVAWEPSAASSASPPPSSWVAAWQPSSTTPPPVDPVAHGSAALIVLSAALLASLLPAARAMREDL